MPIFFWACDETHNHLKLDMNLPHILQRPASPAGKMAGNTASALWARFH